MKQSIITLMEASGEAEISGDAENMSIKDLLMNFEVGTEKRKQWKNRVKTPPKPSELGPISRINFMSTSKQAACAVKRLVKGKEMMYSSSEASRSKNNFAG